MAAPPAVGESKNYFARFGTLAWLSLAQLVRSPSHSRRAEAARRAARHVLWLSAGLGAAIIVLMYAIDAWEIAQMPKRGTPSLWWLRILTDFGKDEYVLAVLAALLIAVALVSPALRGIQRSLLLGLGTRLQFIFWAVAFSNLITEVLKYCIGRGRPFVGEAGTSQATRPITAFRPATPRPPLRSLWRCLPYGPRRAWRWPSMR
jgi:hypothetical protein